jgi:hypothetical protein
MKYWRSLVSRFNRQPLPVWVQEKLRERGALRDDFCGQFICVVERGRIIRLIVESKEPEKSVRKKAS